MEKQQEEVQNLKIQRDLKKLQNKDRANQKHLINLQLFKTKTYYNEQQDIKDQQQYYSDFLSQKKHLNYENLNFLVSSTYKHAKRRENIFSLIDRQQDGTLQCLYTKKILEDIQGNKIMKCDEEHCVPQSYQAGTRKGCGKDMHQIFACEKHANGSRGNKPFGKGVFQDTNLNVKYYIQESESGFVYEYSKKMNENVKLNEIQEAQKKIKTFYPKNNVGACARATLYILICYSESMNELKFPKNLIPKIIDLACNEPVTIWEKHRNQILFELQGNRNPFIDFPDWAKKIDFFNGFQNLKEIKTLH
ncbi:hypothetical protein PPERSA_09626 [Pseudocohnilembus persalinus]|uniref:Uncharacterized protein n=1 Tax=Pseudocohnilembus persalinus TaxID=266149 RepID=A0A0V0QFR9_PSEPJ|nr:hypothetical protein PPERSA_09626 [Pseudocohnilembus persalinus]|eukprot:KRX01020.1 hypothetical protein PPERSA_09626 [Pseudocohnilembus persalinus]